jgi:hypothetical protein
MPPDAATIAYGTGNEPGLPPIDLPKVNWGPQRPTTIVHPSGYTDKPTPPADPWDAAGFTTAPPHGTTTPATDTAGDPWSAAGFTAEHPDMTPEHPVSTAHAALTGALQGMTFGLAPALSGAADASGLPASADIVPGLRPIVGAARLAMGSEGAKPAYEKERAAAQADLEEGRAQHPVASTVGELGGAMMVPLPGGMAGSLGARIAKGIGAGALGGGAYGAGSAISEGQDASGVATAAAGGAALGGAVGGPLAAALGRAPAAGLTRGQRAAATAEGLEAPIPRGLASDNAAVNATTAKSASLPVLGSRISSAVQRTQEAAGRSVEDIAAQTGGTGGRAVQDVMARHGLQGVIDANRQAIDAGYNALRGQLQGRHYTMPATDAALTAIMQARHAAGHVNPAAGLEQFRNVAAGATFNGAHRARVDAREAGNVLVPHPGYNAADFNRLTRAMTTDLRQIVQRDARGSPRQALNAFDRAEENFGRLADQNLDLHRLVNARGEGAIATLLNAGKERGGNLRLLAQLRNSMPPAQFKQIGGALLAELGHAPATGEFSLARFVTGWNKLSPQARAVMFSPAHLAHLDDIVSMGTHIKSALSERNTSHTAGVLVMLDLAQDALNLGMAAAAGTIGGATGVGMAGAAAGGLFVRWLASPARAAAISNWTRAYRAVTLGSPTPARIAAFRIATRNLSSNLGIPMDKIAKAIQGPVAGRADQQDQQQ